MKATGAESLLRAPSLTMRVYPPFRSAARGAMSSNNFLPHPFAEAWPGRSGARAANLLPERDHFFGQRTNGLGFRERRLDTLMFDQAANLIREHRFPVRRGATEFDRLILVSQSYSSASVNT